MLAYTYIVSEMLDLLFSGQSDVKAIGMETGHCIGGCLEVFSWGIQEALKNGQSSKDQRLDACVDCIFCLKHTELYINSGLCIIIHLNKINGTGNIRNIINTE